MLALALNSISGPSLQRCNQQQQQQRLLHHVHSCSSNSHDPVAGHSWYIHSESMNEKNVSNAFTVTLPRICYGRHHARELVQGAAGKPHPPPLRNPPQPQPSPECVCRAAASRSDASFCSLALKSSWLALKFSSAFFSRSSWRSKRFFSRSRSETSRHT